MSKDAAKQKAYRERMKDKGFSSIQVWVRTEDVEKLRKYAKRLRGE